MKWYKVIILDINVYESTIIDERHFGSYKEANEYAARTPGHAIVIQMK